jgi:hypothetical protein
VATAFNRPISFSIPIKVRQFAFSNVKGAASAFGMSKAASVVAPEGPYFAAELPKLYVVTVNELLCLLYGGLVVGGLKIDGLPETTVGPNNVRSILSHFGPFPPADLFTVHKVLFPSVRYRTLKENIP